MESSASYIHRDTEAPAEPTAIQSMEQETALNEHQIDSSIAFEDQEMTDTATGLRKLSSQSQPLTVRRPLPSQIRSSGPLQVRM